MIVQSMKEYENSWNIKCKWVHFQHSRLKPGNRCWIYKCSNWNVGKFQREREHCDWHLHRENVSQHLKQSSSNMRFRIYKHVSVLLFMRKLAFTRTWRSRQMTFRRISWTLLCLKEGFWGSRSDRSKNLLLTGNFCSLRPIVIYNHIFTL